MPIKPTYPGVYIQEERSGVQTIAGVATSIAAFVGTAPRGPIGVPQRVFTYGNFTDIFGQGSEYGELPIQVRQFFMNGGATAWVTRIAKDHKQASANLLASAPGKTALTVTAKDSGLTGNSIQVEIDYNTPSPERTFNMTVYRRLIDNTGKIGLVGTEVFKSLSMDIRSKTFVETIVNSGSNLVEVEVHPDVTTNPTVSTAFVGSISGWLFTQYCQHHIYRHANRCDSKPVRNDKYIGQWSNLSACPFD
jgi:uncharacterized protein